MKANSILRGVMVVALFMTTMFTMTAGAANDSKRISNNVYDEQNNVASTVIYNNDNNTLIPVYRYDFKYDLQNRITEKQTLKWNDGKWSNCILVNINYSSDSANLKFSVWNKDKKQYITTSDYNCNLEDVESNIK